MSRGVTITARRGSSALFGGVKSQHGLRFSATYSLIHAFQRPIFRVRAHSHRSSRAAAHAL